MRIILKAFLSGGPHEGAPGDIRDVDAEQAESLIANGTAVPAPAPEPEPEPAAQPAEVKSTTTKGRKAEETDR